MSKYLDETEQNVSAQFDAAERAGTILFLDEADGLFGRLDDVEAHDGPVVIGARSLQSIPDELRKGLLVVKVPLLVATTAPVSSCAPGATGTIRAVPAGPG